MAVDRASFIVGFVGIVIVVSVLVLNFYSGSTAVPMNLHTTLIMGLVNSNSTTNYIVVPPTIGAPGAIMASTRYLSNGIGGFYPIYTHDLTGNIYVRSRVVWNYTLGDFFEVWGQPLGSTNTLGYHENFSRTNGQRLWYWEMCVVEPGGARPVRVDDWGSHILRNGENITLAFSIAGCVG